MNDPSAFILVDLTFASPHTTYTNHISTFGEVDPRTVLSIFHQPERIFILTHLNNKITKF